jgi:Txe/YoeB family toxin of toxin-antitoxin system
VTSELSRAHLPLPLPRWEIYGDPDPSSGHFEDVSRDPFTGIGKPEPLTYHLPGAWSRRIDDEHRLVYVVTEAEIIILAARYHY